MGIVDKEGFKFHDGLISDFIVVEDNRIDEYIDYINRNQIRKISINDLHYHKNEIEFLKYCPDVEKINMTLSTINNLSILYNLKGLNYLVLEEAAGEFDLSKLGHLEELYVGWNKNLKGLANCTNLKTLALWKYNPKSKDLMELSSLRNLEELTLTQSPILSLRGCGKLPLLKKLELNYLSKLECLDSLEGIADTLKSLRFDSCKKIQNHEYVICLRELELLAFDACGTIPSIDFIRKLPKLKSFIFVNTNIIDGDLSPCIGLDYVGFLNKKHYSHKSEDFKTSE